MRKAALILAGMVATVVGAPAAYANVICVPGNCVDASTGKIAPKASFIVTPMNVDSKYRGPISASLGNTVMSKGAFKDTFNFLLPTNGVGGGSVTTVAASFKGATDLDFTSVLINGVSATIFKTARGIVEVAFASDIPLSAGMNLISVSGLSRGNGSYGGSISFTPSVPETATWGMMILGFMGMGATMRYRRKSTKVAFA
ncbi:MAG: hypothetical protein EOO77_25935 [Oxalobacteraceae bacterium]|nr:MAG: hypothetical protein EOO77_25935 [Oxalobacteraceae bacterium]